MTNLVYPLCNRSRWNDNDIRYSLRSVEKNLSNYGDIYIIGYKPEFLTNVIHISADDPHEIPDFNIRDKVLKACAIPELSENFLFMNDDHYLLKPFDANTFPYYYSGELFEKAKKRGTDSYARRLNYTAKHLSENGYQTKHFDIHTPIIYNKSEFLRIFSDLNVKGSFGYVIKSMYCNIMRIEGVEKEDSKGDKIPRAKETIFSTTPRVSGAVARFLNEQFPDKSKFEI